MLKCPLRCVLRVQKAINFLRHGSVVGVPSGGDTSSFLQETCENWCLSVSRGCATTSCETSQHNCLQWSEMGLPAGLSSCPQDQDDTGVAAEACSSIYQARGLALGSPDLNPLDYKLLAVLEDMAC